MDKQNCAWQLSCLEFLDWHLVLKACKCWFCFQEIFGYLCLTSGEKWTSEVNKRTSKLVFPWDFSLGSVCEMPVGLFWEMWKWVQRGSQLLFQKSVKTWMAKWIQQVGKIFLSVSIVLGISVSFSAIQAFGQCKYKLEELLQVWLLIGSIVDTDGLCEVLSMVALTRKWEFLMEVFIVLSCHRCLTEGRNRWLVNLESLRIFTFGKEMHFHILFVMISETDFSFLRFMTARWVPSISKWPIW